MGQRNLPLASGQKHVEAFIRLGWEPRDIDDSHIVLGKPGFPYNLSIPNHDEVKRPLLADQLKLAGISESEYLGAFHKRRPRAPRKPKTDTPSK